jgi:hypothetical protein
VKVVMPKTWATKMYVAALSKYIKRHLILSWSLFKDKATQQSTSFSGCSLQPKKLRTANSPVCLPIFVFPAAC